jgi:hypothetical protein
VTLLIACNIRGNKIHVMASHICETIGVWGECWHTFLPLVLGAQLILLTLMLEYLVRLCRVVVLLAVCSLAMLIPSSSTISCYADALFHNRIGVEAGMHFAAQYLGQGSSPALQLVDHTWFIEVWIWD